MLVMPIEVEWIIKRNSADLTSRSLRGMDATSGSLRWEFRRGMLVMPAELARRRQSVACLQGLSGNPQPFGEAFPKQLGFFGSL